MPGEDASKQKLLQIHCQSFENWFLLWIYYSTCTEKCVVFAWDCFCMTKKGESGGERKKQQSLSCSLTLCACVCFCVTLCTCECVGTVQRSHPVPIAPGLYPSNCRSQSDIVLLWLLSMVLHISPEMTKSLSQCPWPPASLLVLLHSHSLMWPWTGIGHRPHSRDWYRLCCSHAYRSAGLSGQLGSVWLSVCVFSPAPKWVELSAITLKKRSPILYYIWARTRELYKKKKSFSSVSQENVQLLSAHILGDKSAHFTPPSEIKWLDYPGCKWNTATVKKKLSWLYSLYETRSHQRNRKNNLFPVNGCHVNANVNVYILHIHPCTKADTCLSCSLCPWLGGLSDSEISDWYIQSHPCSQRAVTPTVNHCVVQLVRFSLKQFEPFQKHAIMNQQWGKCTVKNTAMIALWSIINFFLPQLIIEFNYSESVFLICFPHFLLNWLCVPVFPRLLSSCIPVSVGIVRVQPCSRWVFIQYYKTQSTVYRIEMHILMHECKSTLEFSLREAKICTVRRSWAGFEEQSTFRRVKWNLLLRINPVNCQLYLSPRWKRSFHYYRHVAGE